MKKSLSLVSAVALSLVVGSAVAANTETTAAANTETTATPAKSAMETTPHNSCKCCTAEKAKQ